MTPGLAVVVLWIGFALSWLAALVWSRPTARRLGFRKELGYRLVLLLGALVLAVPAHGAHGGPHLWYLPYPAVWPVIALIAAGFAFAWWARIHLGTLWSGHITTKADHRVVDTGPYAIVRHPIYSGILLAIYATAALKGTAAGLAGAAIITLGLWMKARLEESWLRHALGDEVYDNYRRRVPMLLPFGPKGA